VKRENNEGGLIPRAFFVRSPGASTVMFRYYLLGGDIAAPSGYMLGFVTHFYFLGDRFLLAHPIYIFVN